MLGSLLVGMSFAKALSWSQGIPFIAVDHMLAHLYASQFITNESEPPEYPFLGLLVSGGHSIICRVDDFDKISVLGATIDDAVGEAFDKVAKHYGLGYPGGLVIDKLSQSGDAGVFNFPMPSLHKGKHPNAHRYDVSYSGLKNAVINQIEQFRVKEKELCSEDIAASFQKTAIDILLRSLFRAVEDTKLSKVVSGGGVAANSYLRAKLSECKDINCVFPPIDLCGDNGAMVAGLGFQYLNRGEASSLRAVPSSRVGSFKKSGRRQNKIGGFSE
jgi:N6-L-threonylcarbamoyladenine synthase